ncbi:MAG TPA: maltose ABC transporter permease [Firmicutes bacterium]|jgi:ABC-type maltose transport system permease subunit|nr:maltose ABC transporter permease [Bacillota bacterium]HBE06717.1 maltose ABC transporter permease [Bacillota bacterium]HBL49717.1 maltose ABC transporter permease [Bacillota bacterium]HCX70640.1 maltose ABC transporter permease [Bacillota bacterium]
MAEQGHRSIKRFFANFLNRFWRHALIWVCIVFALFPVVWIISASLDPANSIAGQKLIPPNASFINFQRLFQSEQHPFGIWFLNTFKLCIVTATLVVLITSLAAYAFSRLRFKGRRSGLFAILLIQMFPQMLAMVAIYLIIFMIGDYIPALGLDTHAGLILVYLGGAMGANVWLLKGFFDTIPKSLEESAMIDGATHFQIFWRIILPLARPILVVVFFLQFMATYSEFVIARVLLADTNNLTMAVGLQTFIADQYAKRWGVFAAAALIGALPIVILYWFLQKHLVSGLTRGAVKG